jgi:hypothetical protein
MPGFQYQPYDNSGSIGQILQLMQAGAHAHADAARQTAEANSRAAQIKAQNSAQLAGSLGSIIANTGQQIAQPFTPEGRAHQMQIEEQQRTVEEDKALRTLFAQGSPKPEDVYRVVGPKRGADIIKGFSALQEQNIKTDDAKVGKVANLTAGILALPEPMQPDAYKLARTHLLQLGFKPEDIPEQYSKAFVQQAQQSALTAKDRMEAARAETTATEANRHNVAMEGRPVAVAPGSSLVAPSALQAIPGQPAGQPVAPIYTAPERVQKPASVQEFEYAKTQGYKGSYEQYQTQDANRKRPVVNVSAANAVSDVKEAVTGMREGTIPPQLPGRASKEYTAMMAEAHRQGYDLAKAATDWSATQKHFATLNGAQQTRIRQAVDTAYHSLDVIDDLADQWKGGRFPALNRATLTAAKNGVMGKDAQLIATQLDAQITDLTSELGNVYMGGNSPTDHALGLASKNLNAAWSNDVLKSMTKLARTNLEIRRNAIANVGAIDSGGERTTQAQPAAAPPASAKPAPGGQILVTAPDGSKHPFTTQAQADAFKRLAGIQ